MRIAQFDYELMERCRAIFSDIAANGNATQAVRALKHHCYITGLAAGHVASNAKLNGQPFSLMHDRNRESARLVCLPADGQLFTKSLSIRIRDEVKQRLSQNRSAYRVE